MAQKYGKKVRELMIKEMKDVFTSKKGFIFASVENVKASEIDGFRQKIHKAGSRYFVVKNRLADIAFKESGIEGFSDITESKKTLGIGVIDNDPVQISKIMTEFAKKNKGFNVGNGYLEGKALSEERVKELADLPSREQLIAMVVGMMNAPIAGFAGVLSSLLRSILYVLTAVKEKKEGK